MLSPQRFTGRMSPMPQAILRALVPVVLSMSLAACTINIGLPNQNPSHSDSPMGTSETDSDYSMRDLMFAQMMIPHHEQAIEMSELALEVSNSPELRDLAQRIIEGQSVEVDQMRGWLAEAQWDSGPMGNRDMPGSDGMGGMASEEELAELAERRGADFDQFFFALMIEHHEGALVMVRMIAESQNPEVAGLAADIVRVQTEEIAEMESLRETTA